MFGMGIKISNHLVFPPQFADLVLMEDQQCIITNSYTSPVGELILGSWGDSLCLCDWRYRDMREAIDRRISNGLIAEFKEGDSEVIRATIYQLDAYFSKELHHFTIPLVLVGTDFQKLVWNELLTIPHGQTISYHELSRRLGDPGAIRAVASANGANAISLLVPCHRVIGSDGSLVGYAGGIRAKQKLLELEGMSEQLSMF